MRMLALLLFLFGSPVWATECVLISDEGGPGAPVVIEGLTAPCITYTGRFVVLERATIGPNDGIDNHGNGILVYGDDLVVRWSTIRDQPQNGIHGRCRMSTADGSPCTDYPKRVRIISNRIERVGRNGVKCDFCDWWVINKTRITESRSSAVQANVVNVGWDRPWDEPGAVPPFEITWSELDHFGYDEDGHRAHAIYTGEPGRIESNRIHHGWGYGLHVWPGFGPRTTKENPLVFRFNRTYRMYGSGTVTGREGPLVYWHNAEYYNDDSDLLP